MTYIFVTVHVCVGGDCAIYRAPPPCLQLTPEEEEKRRVRRERNKLAAAKCRNRRRELTEMLQGVSLPHSTPCWHGPHMTPRAGGSAAAFGLKTEPLFSRCHGTVFPGEGL